MVPIRKARAVKADGGNFRRGVAGALQGEAGARALILAESARCRFLDVDDQGVLADVDTPEALRAAEAVCAS